jgi:hypothetical protein
MNLCDPVEIREAFDDATVDCYGEDEQVSGLIEMTAQELVFPFKGTVMGESISVVDAIASEHDGFGMDLVVEHKRKRFAIAASSVELIKPLPEGHVYLAALLDWKSKL